jgi:hypothetical protein
MGKKTKITGITLGIVLLGMQFYRPERTNPTSDPARSFEAIEKPSPQVMAVLNRSCTNCHSHQTVWPWYSAIAPASWLVADDVAEGREHLNLSDWARVPVEKRAHKLEEVCEETRKGDMPPRLYLMLHPEAKLSEQDSKLLCSLAPAKP